MLVQPMLCYSGFLKALLEGSMPPLVSGDVSAHIFEVSYEPDLSGYAYMDGIKTHEIACSDYSPQQVTGRRVTPSVLPATGWIFASDTISFGDPITLPIFRYLVLASGLPRQDYATKRLVAFADLAPDGAREVINSKLEFLPGTDGWLAISSSA